MRIIQVIGHRWDRKLNLSKPCRPKPLQANAAWPAEEFVDAQHLSERFAAYLY